MAELSKVRYRSASGRLEAEISGGSAKDIFEGIAQFQEVFEAANKCGECGSEHIRFNVRHVTKGKQEFAYYEMKCLKCYSRLQFGQNQDMKNLFPKRTDENGNYMPNFGWAKYQAPKEDKDI